MIYSQGDFKVSYEFEYKNASNFFLEKLLTCSLINVILLKLKQKRPKGV